MMLHRGAADGMLCGTFGTHAMHLHYVDQVIGLRPGVKNYYAMNVLLLPKRTVFICDTYVNFDPSAEQVAEMAVLAAEEIRRFGINPKAALLSHSSFGTSDQPSAMKMRQALALIQARAPELEIDGEMHGDARRRFPALAPQRRGESSAHAHGGCGQHRFQSAQDGRRRRYRDRPDPARCGQAGAYTYALGHGAAHRQYGGVDRDGRERGAQRAAAFAVASRWIGPNLKQA
jgi:hypothetical protein